MNVAVGSQSGVRRVRQAVFGGDGQSFRFRLLCVLSIVTMGVFLMRLVYVQVVSSSHYGEIAAGNRVRETFSAAQRGSIFDRNGNLIAGSRDSFSVAIDISSLASLSPEERKEVFARLSEIVDNEDNIAAPNIEAAFEKNRGLAPQSFVVAQDISSETWLRLSEQKLPGVTVEIMPVRTYPQGALAAHSLGHLGQLVDDAEVVEFNRQAGSQIYHPGDLVGRSGLEKRFEAQLSGTPEARLVEIDSKNRFVRTVEVSQHAVAGEDIYLTIDLELQQFAEQALQDQLQKAKKRDFAAGAGSIVIVEPSTGQVRAMASYPTFEPADFLFGLDENDSANLNSDANKPFLNRAISGRYPAGSTFKPVTAYAGLATNTRSADEIWSDQGSYTLKSCSASTGCTFRNAKSIVMGDINLAGALTQSSDTYFYSLGEQLWLNRELSGREPIQQSATMFGFGATTGIELAGESSGVVPGPAQRAEAHEQNPEIQINSGWYAGDNVNLSIGQGDLLVTPLQLANAYGAIATGSTPMPTTMIAAETKSLEQQTQTDQPNGAGQADSAPKRTEPFGPESLSEIRKGLAQVTTTGTAARSFENFPHDRYQIFSKTGTAEIAGRDDYSLFAGYIKPADGSETLAFAAVLEESGFGGNAAAPAMNQILRRYDRSRRVSANETS